MKIKKAKWLFVVLAILMLVSLVSGVTGAEHENGETYGFCGYKYVDGEPTEGWEILLEVEVNSEWAKFGQEGLVNPATTGPDGKYCFDGLPAGTYRASEVQQAGYTQVYPVGYHEVKLPLEPYVYGVVGLLGDIYKININTREETLIYTGAGGYSVYYPNALAFDNVNGRLYFSINKTELYFIDVTEDDPVMVKAGEFTHGTNNAYSGTFGDGKYWYIPDHSQLLYEITFNADGTIASDAFVDMFAGKSLGAFGDIAYADGFIYGSHQGQYFTYDIAGADFNFIDNADANYLQLAIGSDGVLYGHNYPAKAWYSVDPSTGVKSDLLFTGAYKYWDLANALHYFNFRNETDREPVCETAWAKGETSSPNNEVENETKTAKNPSNAWGWTNWYDGQELVMELWAGAGQNDTTKGKLVGTVTVTCNGEEVTVVYQVNEGHWITEAHLWVGNTPLPLVEVGRFKTPTPTSAPGQFCQDYDYDADERTATFVIPYAGCQFWVAAHAVVCWYQ